MIREPAFDRNRARRAGLLLCRLLLAVVFVSAGVAKLLASPQAFADSVASFRLVPSWLVSPLTLALPPFEILVGAALLADRPSRLGAGGALVLAGVFLVAMITALVRGIPVDCGCFGPGAAWLPLTAARRMWFDLGRDLLLLVAALGLYRHQLAASSPPAIP